MERPSYLQQQIASLEQRRNTALTDGLNSQAQQYEQQLNDYRSKLNGILKGEIVPTDAGGNQVTFWADNARRAAGAQSKFAEGEQTAKAARQDALNAGQAQLQLQTLISNYRALPQTGITSPGPSANARLAVVRNFGTALQVLGVPQPAILAAPGAAEALSKDTVKLASEMTKAMGSHEAASVFNSITAATPSLGNSPQGFNRIAAGMEQALAYKKAKAEFLTSYVNKEQKLEGVDKAFEAFAPVQQFVATGIVGAIPAQLQAQAVDYIRQYGSDPRAIENLDKQYGNGTGNAIRYLMQRGRL